MSGWGIVGTLVRASLEGGLFVAAVWAVCRLVPRLPAAVRCGLWWAACLKLLLGLVALPAVRLPLLPAVERAAPTAAVVAEPLYIRNVASLSPVPSPDPEEGQRITVREVGVSSVLGLWLLGLLILCGKAFRQLRETRRIVRSAEPVREGWVRAAFAAICERLGIRRAPDLRGSGEVRTPQVIGLAQPVVLLPRAGLERMTPAEVAMTLCHELVHLRRKDLWLGWVPALAHRIFFFHPLAALAAREYAIAREAACDAEVLRILGTAPQAYGRLLLRWGVAPRETGLAAAGASPSLQNLKRRLQMLQQSSDNKRRMSGWWWLAGAAVLAGLVPLRIVAQAPAPEAVAAPEAAVAPEAAAAPEAAPAPEATAAPEAAEAPEATPAPEAPEAAPAVAPAPSRGGIPGGVRGGVKGGVKGGIPGGVEGGISGGVEGAIADGVKGGVEGVPVVAPVAPRSPRPVATPRPGVAAPTPRPAIAPGVPVPTPRPAVAPVAPLPPGPTPRPGVAPRPMAKLAGMPTPAPAPTPAPRAQGVPAPPPAPPAPPAPPKPPKPPKQHGYSYHSGDHGDSFVLMYGGDDNSVTMSGSMDDIQKVKRLRGSSKDGVLWFQRNGKEYVVRDPALLKQMRDLYKPVSELGAKQGELGGRQGALGGRQGALGARQGALGAELGALAADRARRGEAADDRDFEKREKEINRKMEELGRQMEDLGRQQEVLGKQQEELGRQQEAASAKADKEVHELMDRAIHSGEAQEVK